MSVPKKIFISLFIVLNLLAMVRVHVPFEKPFLAALFRPIDSYLGFFSIYQNWTMFSPNPARTNVYVTAEVEFADGSKDTYMLPRNSDLTLGEKYVFGERMRVLTEAIRRDDGRFLWRDVSKFSLRQVKDKNYNKIPLRVNLVRHWQITPDIKERFIPHATSNNVFNSFKFYTYEVL